MTRNNVFKWLKIDHAQADRSFLMRNLIMLKPAPHQCFAPIIIAGISIGFMASAYTFIFHSTHVAEPATTPSDDSVP
jgi:hypothetical protein